MRNRHQQRYVIPPDGGWGWVVVVGAFFICGIVDGIAMNSGTIYVYFPSFLQSIAAVEAKEAEKPSCSLSSSRMGEKVLLDISPALQSCSQLSLCKALNFSGDSALCNPEKDYFLVPLIDGIEREPPQMQMDPPRLLEPMATIFVGATLISIYMLIGPFAAALINIYGSRRIIIIGSLIATAGFASSALLVNHENLLLLTHGIAGGIGLGLMNVGAIVSVGLYFDSRRSLAIGLALCGSGVGMTVAPLIIEQVLTQGLDFAYFMLACFTLQGCIAGALVRPIRPVDWTVAAKYRRKDVVDRMLELAKSATRGRRNSQASLDTPERLEHIKRAVMQTKTRRQAKLGLESGGPTTPLVGSKASMGVSAGDVNFLALNNQHGVSSHQQSFLSRKNASPPPDSSFFGNVFGSDLLSPVPRGAPMPNSTKNAATIELHVTPQCTMITDDSLSSNCPLLASADEHTQSTILPIQYIGDDIAEEDEEDEEGDDVEMEELGRLEGQCGSGSRPGTASSRRIQSDIPPSGLFCPLLIPPTEIAIRPLSRLVCTPGGNSDELVFFAPPTACICSVLLPTDGTSPIPTKKITSSHPDFAKSCPDMHASRRNGDDDDADRNHLLPVCAPKNSTTTYVDTSYIMDMAALIPNNLVPVFPDKETKPSLSTDCQRPTAAGLPMSDVSIISPVSCSDPPVQQIDANFSVIRRPRQRYNFRKDDDDEDPTICSIVTTDNGCCSSSSPLSGAISRHHFATTTEDNGSRQVPDSILASSPLSSRTPLLISPIPVTTGVPSSKIESFDAGAVESNGDNLLEPVIPLTVTALSGNNEQSSQRDSGLGTNTNSSNSDGEPACNNTRTITINGASTESSSKGGTSNSSSANGNIDNNTNGGHIDMPVAMPVVSQLSSAEDTTAFPTQVKSRRERAFKRFLQSSSGSNKLPPLTSTATKDPSLLVNHHHAQPYDNLTHISTGGIVTANGGPLSISNVSAAAAIEQQQRCQCHLRRDFSNHNNNNNRANLSTVGLPSSTTTTTTSEQEYRGDTGPGRPASVFQHLLAVAKAIIDPSLMRDVRFWLILLSNLLVMIAFLLLPLNSDVVTAVRELSKSEAVEAATSSSSSLINSQPVTTTDCSHFLTNSDDYCPAFPDVPEDPTSQPENMPHVYIVLLSVCGSAQTIVRALAGFFADHPRVDPAVLVAVTTCVGSVALFLLGTELVVQGGIVIFIFLLLVVSASCGVFFALAASVIIDAFGVERLTSCFGMINMVRGLAPFVTLGFMLSVTKLDKWMADPASATDASTAETSLEMAMMNSSSTFVELSSSESSTKSSTSLTEQEDSVLKSLRPFRYACAICGLLVLLCALSHLMLYWLKLRMKNKQQQQISGSKVINGVHQHPQISQVEPPAR